MIAATLRVYQIVLRFEYKITHSVVIKSTAI